MGIDNTTRATMASEADGQRQLVASDPLLVHCETPPAFEAMGFAFGDTAEDDPSFRAATLPAGWTRHATDHGRWSHIHDGHGRHRAAIFHKAAHHDRGYMRLLGPEEYVRTCVTDDVEPITDDTWATPAAVRESALVLALSYDRRADAFRRDGDTDEALALATTARKAAALAVRVALDQEVAS